MGSGPDGRRQGATSAQPEAIAAPVPGCARVWSERVKSAPPLRVLVLVDSLALGGAESLLTSFVGAAPSAGLEVSVAVVTGKDDSRLQMLPAFVEQGADPEFLGISRLLSLRGVPETVRAVRRSRCDVVHAHLEYAATLAAPAGWMTGRPVVSTFHHVPSRGGGWRSDVRERLAVAAASYSARTVFVSESSRARFASRYRKMANRNWRVIRNGVDVSTFSPAARPVPSDLGVPEGVPVVLLPAALRGGKGHEVVLEAWPRVIEAHPGAHVIFAGSGDEEARLRGLAEEYGIAGYVVFAGFRTDVARLMQASSLVLLPSRTEALPTVLMEAAACGRAVVASNVEGIPEVVADGETGLLVDPDDPEGLAGAINELLGDHRRRDQMAAQARRRAESDFSLQRWMAELRSLYESALDDRRH